jgi:hypothetical protein
MSTTRARIVSLLTRIPQGVPRASLHGVTGETPLIHEALRQLIDEGVVVERLVKTVRGKPRREYVLTSNLQRLGLQETEEPAEATAEALPGAKAIVEYVVQNYPGTSRSEMWSKAVVTKGWVASALGELIREGKVKEVLEEDNRGGLVRRYFPVSPTEESDEPVRVAS